MWKRINSIPTIKELFPNGMTYREYPNEKKVKIYREGPILASWQIVMPMNEGNKEKLRAICEAINKIVG